MSKLSDLYVQHDESLYLSDNDDDENEESKDVITDCLVLKIEEHCLHNNIDMTLYILYDTKKHNYVIRGKRVVTKKYNSQDFSFTCNCSNNLMSFIDLVVNEFVNRNIVLYNYNNLPYHSNDITYDFLQKHDDPDYEIVAYDDVSSDEIDLLRLLNMLKTVYNTY